MLHSGWPADINVFAMGYDVWRIAEVLIEGNLSKDSSKTDFFLLETYHHLHEISMSARFV
jgi:hypothetical protein